MISPEFFIETLLGHGIDFYAGVPDSLLQNICAYITDNIPADHNIITANEGNAIALASGHYLATGKPALVYMQNSGIGNAVNPLLSLADQKVYSIPMILLIGWRGEPGVHDEPQHVKQGEVTLSLLDTMDIPYQILPEDQTAATIAIETTVENAIKESRPYVLVVRKGTFEKYSLKNKTVNPYRLSREEAMKYVIDTLPEEAAIVSTTGKLSRELFEYREALNQGHSHDFLTVGSMGHASSIALGIALSKSDRPVFCFDGDGAFLMHLGALTNIGELSPVNYIHILFNNGAHESVGGQPTLGFGIDTIAIVKGCGYAHGISVETCDGIKEALNFALEKEGPTFIEIRCGINSRSDLGRPTTSPIENRDAFMKFLR